ncbi:MAG: hypothetical protein MUP47_00655 [Phycisphaerae bacterium]|nr:hypothetical protein [Phycisphaerae bacterium]
MDRSKPDRAGGGAERRDPPDQPRTKTILVKLSRGGPQEWTYYRLSPRQKKEWDAVEDIIETLAKGRCLYSYGPIHAERIRSKYWIGTSDSRRAIGVTAVPTRSHLHEVLVCNVEERFHFVVTHRDISDAEALEIWHHIDACLPNAALVDRHAYVHCAVVEMANHECFEVIFRKEDSQEVTGIIQGALAHPFLP